MPRTFDEKELLQRVDDDWDFLDETVQMLSAEGPALVEEIRRSAAAGDAPGVARAAHTLKGMISNFCSPAAHASAIAVERIGKDGDLAVLPDLLDALEDRLNTLIVDLTGFLATRA